MVFLNCFISYFVYDVLYIFFWSDIFCIYSLEFLGDASIEFKILAYAAVGLIECDYLVDAFHRNMWGEMSASHCFHKDMFPCCAFNPLSSSIQISCGNF